jgi:LPPG:FO 2-phospho-L-lactate transferase
VVPATDDRLRTVIETDAGPIDFQTYFVKNRQADAVRGLRYDGAERAHPSPAAEAALGEAELIVIGPSNPLVSIGPILAIPGYREALERARVPRIGVSGIVAGRAIRGPADRMLTTLGHEATARGVAALYAGLLDRFVIDEVDATLAPAIAELGMEPVVLPTVMRTDHDRARLARAIVALA